MIIYKEDGSFFELSDSQVTIVNITPDDIERIYNYLDGVKIDYKNGRSTLIENATTDGISITISQLK